MFIIDKNGIGITRGDTAKFRIAIKYATGEAYEIAEGDVVKFTVKKNVNESWFMLQKTADSDGVFRLEPSDTKSFAFGTYVYDVQLETADGDVYTVVEPSRFVIKKEVT